MKQKVTLSIDSEVYKQFKKYCDEHAFLLSKKIELWMSEELTRSKQTQGMKKEQSK